MKARRIASWLLFSTLSALVAAQSGLFDLTPSAKVDHPPIEEMSGIVASRRHPGVFWVHSDSGHPNRLFAIRLNGSVVAPDRVQRLDGGVASSFAGIEIVGARNVDWEDVAIDGDRLYVADVGNNANSRRDLGVYVVEEPDPRQDTRVRIVERLPIQYPDQTSFPPEKRHFDCEAVFVAEGKLYFLTKHRTQDGVFPEPSTHLYRLDTRHADRPNLLVKIDSKADMGGWVTAADLSPDGRTLAVLTHLPIASIWLFERPDSGDRFLSSRSRRLILRNAKQCEGVAWNGAGSLVVTNEQREIFQVPLDAFPVASTTEATTGPAVAAIQAERRR
jgi:hypothetical protein